MMADCSRLPRRPARIRRTAPRGRSMQAISIFTSSLIFIIHTSSAAPIISRRNGDACTFGAAEIMCSDYTLSHSGTNEAGAPPSNQGQRFADAKATAARLFVANSIVVKEGQNRMQSCLEECSTYPADECVAVYLWKLSSGSVKCIGLKATADLRQVTSTADDYSFTRQPAPSNVSDNGDGDGDDDGDDDVSDSNISTSDRVMGWWLITEDNPATTSTTTATTTSTTTTSTATTSTSSSTTNTGPVTTATTKTTLTTTTPCLRVDLRPSCEQYLEMGHCSPTSVLYTYMATSCLGTCIDIPCPGSPTTVPTTSTRTTISSTTTSSVTTVTPAPPPPMIERTAPLSSTLSSTSSTSTEAPSTTRNATKEVAAASGVVVSSTARVAAPSTPAAAAAASQATVTVAPPVITITTWNSANRANSNSNSNGGGGNDDGGNDDATATMSAAESVNVILIALGASVLSTACGIACVLYRYESPRAKRKLTAQLAAALASAKINGDAAEAVDTVLARATDAKGGASRPRLLGLLQSVEGVNAVIREAARRGVVGDIPPGYTTDSVSNLTRGHQPGGRGGRANLFRQYHSDGGVQYPSTRGGAYPQNNRLERRGSEILNSYLMSRAQSDPNGARRQGRGRMPTARRQADLRSSGSNEAMEILRQFPVVSAGGSAHAGSYASNGSSSSGSSSSDRFAIPAFGNSSAFRGGAGGHSSRRGNRKRNNNGGGDGDGGVHSSKDRRNGFAVPTNNVLSTASPRKQRPQPQPASTAVRGARSRAAVFAQVPRGEAGAVVPQFADADGYFNAYGMVTGNANSEHEQEHEHDDDNQSSFTDDDDEDRQYYEGGGRNSVYTNDDSSDDDNEDEDEDEDDTYANDTNSGATATATARATRLSNVRRKTRFEIPRDSTSSAYTNDVMNTSSFPALDPASAIERAFALEAGLEYNAGEYDNHGDLGMMDEYFANGGDGFIDEDEFDVVTSNDASLAEDTGSIAESASMRSMGSLGASTVYDGEFQKGLFGRRTGLATDLETIISEEGDGNYDSPVAGAGAGSRRGRGQNQSQSGTARTFSVSSEQRLIRSGSPVYTFVDKNRSNKNPNPDPADPRVISPDLDDEDDEGGEDGRGDVGGAVVVGKLDGGGGSSSSRGGNHSRGSSSKSGYTFIVGGGDRKSARRHGSSKSTASVDDDQMIWDDGAERI